MLPRIKPDGTTRVTVTADNTPARTEPPEPTVTVYAYNTAGELVGESEFSQSFWGELTEEG